jgi:hypothetical protein
MGTYNKMKKLDEKEQAEVVRSNNLVNQSVLTPPIDGSPAAAIVSDTSTPGSPSVDRAPEPSIASATAAITDNGQTTMTKLIALLPVERQAEGSSLVLDLVKQAREEGLPFDPHKSALALSRGKKYRRSNRSPREDKQ